MDTDFQAVDGDTSLLYRPQDIIKEEEAVEMSRLRWLRPKEISVKQDLVGFTKVGRVAEEEKLNLTGSETADFRRISYGDILEDRWFLNALSLIA